MFDIGWSEMAVIMLVALVVIGPKDLPRLARTLGQWAAKGRAMAREFQRSLEDMAREAELDDVKREIEKIGRTNIRRSIEKTIDPTGELGRAFQPNGSSKAAGKGAVASSANGEAKEPSAVDPEPAEPEAAVQPGTATVAATAKDATPRAKAKPKPAARRKTAKPKTAAEATTAAASTPKPASSESGEAETVAEPR
ncbi:MAG TPA: Sec-independent protein translocase protein TatB [Geminicoccaceae bacterium]|nr:Sec-independent protein translocase protein TatB [Geminicoccaceae bacterium]